jgi:hypothetical protein
MNPHTADSFERIGSNRSTDLVIPRKPDKNFTANSSHHSMEISSPSDESSSAHQSEGSFMPEAAVSAKNTSIFFVRRLPISGLCWTACCVSHTRTDFLGSTYQACTQYRDRSESLESSQHHSSCVSMSLRSRRLEMAIFKLREHSPSTSWPETLSVSNSFQG